MSSSDFITALLVPATVAGEVFIVVLIIALVRAAAQHRSNAVTSLVGKYGLVLAFLIALAATLGSLGYSEIAGFEPCRLCWYQRIFMYPLVILFDIALWKKEEISRYALPLVAIGGAIAAFHYIGQMFLPDLLTCEAVGYSVSCAQRFFVGLGHITLPFMSFVAFVFIGLLVIAHRQWIRQ